MQRIDDVSIAAHVLVQSLDPDDLRAHGDQVGDAGLVAGAEESWGVVVTILHHNHHLRKVPLHGDLLIPDLRRNQGLLKCQGLSE